MYWICVFFCDFADAAAASGWLSFGDPFRVGSAAPKPPHGTII